MRGTKSRPNKNEIFRVKLKLSINLRGIYSLREDIKKTV